jgi:hypothetical protein
MFTEINLKYMKNYNETLATRNVCVQCNSKTIPIRGII